MRGSCWLAACYTMSPSLLTVSILTCLGPQGVQTWLAPPYCLGPTHRHTTRWRVCLHVCMPAHLLPAYLLDRPPARLQAFASACPHLVGDYRMPAVFTEDLFEVLGEERRPDYRCGVCLGVWHVMVGRSGEGTQHSMCGCRMGWWGGRHMPY